MPEAAVPGASLLFLREEHIRQAQDMFFLAWRDLAACVDPVLAAHGLGRAHHRALHFIGRHPGLTVTDLLSMLCVTKQSLSRVLAPLVAQGLVLQVASRGDRRQRLLHLSDTVPRWSGSFSTASASGSWRPIATPAGRPSKGSAV